MKIKYQIVQKTKTCFGKKPQAQLWRSKQQAQTGAINNYLHIQGCWYDIQLFSFWDIKKTGKNIIKLVILIKASIQLCIIADFEAEEIIRLLQPVEVPTYPYFPRDT